MKPPSPRAELAIPDTLPELIRGLAKAPETPETLLIAAVINQACEDVRGAIGSCNSKRVRRRIQADAAAWLCDATSPNAFGGAAWGLKFCCESLGIAPSWAVRTLANKAEGPVRRARFLGPRVPKMNTRRAA